MARWMQCCICKERVRPTLVQIYRITPEEADVYFRDLWLVVHRSCHPDCLETAPYSDREIGSILTGFSLSICKAIKEVPALRQEPLTRTLSFARWSANERVDGSTRRTSMKKDSEDREPYEKQI